MRLIGLTLALCAPLTLAHAADEVVAEPLQDGESIVVNGVLDEEAWSRAIVIDSFVGIHPTEGFAPAGHTEVRVLVDDQRIYFGFHCRFDEPTRVRGYLAEREDVNQDDQVGIYLDPFGDGRRANIFYLNALGVQQDMLVTLEGAYNPSWDAVFKSVGRLVDGGYDMEVALPFRSLRFPIDGELPWRIMFTRKFVARDEKVAFPAIHTDLGPSMLQFVPLRNVRPKRSGIGLEIMPTVSIRTGQDRASPDEDLVWREPGFPDTVDPGLDLKYQVTPSLSVDATVNPDFSQVEADPNFVDNNLRFALFLPERRPFFLEGRELYDGSLLYTRSVVDPIYGAKFSGKAGPVSLAVLQALDERPSASVVGERETPGFSAADVRDALSFVSYAGAKVDLGRNSQLALAYTDKELVGRDGVHRSSHHALRANGRLGLDEVSWLAVDGTLSSTGALGGDRLLGGQVGLAGARNERLQGVGGNASITTPDHRAENGFLTRPDFGSVHGWLRRRFEWSGGQVPWIEFGAKGTQSWEGFDPDADVTRAGASVNGWFNVRLPGITDLRTSVTAWDSSFAGLDFNGGTATVGLMNNALEALRGGFEMQFGDAIRFSDATPTVERRFAAELHLRAFRRLTVSLSTTASFLGLADEPLEQLWVYRARLLLGIVRPLQVRLIVQGRQQAVFGVDRKLQSRSDGLDISALVTFLPTPGTAVHVGFGERLNWGPLEQPRTDRRDLFLKASVLFRI